MIHNNTSVMSIQDIQDVRERTVPWVAIYSLRIAGSLAIVSNILVLLCTLHLRRNFRSRDYWIQIVILSSFDAFNGTVSLLLSFLIFDTNYIWCGVLLFLYMFSQINTLCAICCICVNRYKGLKNMDKIGGDKMCRQELGITFVSAMSIVYCLTPYFIWDLVEFENKNCTAPVLFGLNNAPYLLHTSIGVLVPLSIINILYIVCLYKLWKSKNSVAPGNLQSSTMADSASTTKKIYGNAHAPSEETVKAPLSLNTLSTSGQSGSGDTGQTSTSTTLDDPIKQARLKVSGQSYAREPRLAFKERREAQCRAIKLLGIILILADLATIIPLSVLLRQAITSLVKGTVSKGGSGNSIGVTCLSINALVDAFVYGLYSREIRKYLKGKVSDLWRAVSSRL